MTALPASWTTRPLGELGSPVRKSFTPESEIEYEVWSVPSFADGRPERLKGSEIGSAKLQVEPGDVLISKINPRINRVWQVTDQGNGLMRLASPEWLVFRTADDVLSGYLRHLLSAPDFRQYITDAVSGVTGSHTRAKADHILRFEVPVPPLDEQQRIVATLEDHLSRLEAALRLADSSVQRFAVFERSLIRSVLLGKVGPASGTPIDPGTGLPVGWSWKTWPEVGESQNGKAFSSRLYQSEGVRLIRPGNLSTDGSMSWTESNTRHLPLEVADENPRYVVGEGEIIMNLTAQSLKDDFLGRVCMTGTGEIALLNQRLARLTPKHVSPRFAYFVFRSPMFRDFVAALNTGSLIQHMFTKQLAQFRLPVPAIDEQVAMELYLDETLERARGIRRLLAPLRERGAGLHSSLLAAAFSGQLTKEPVHV